MPLHLAARMHAFVYGLFQPDDRAETRLLYNNVEQLLSQHGWLGDQHRADSIVSIAHEVMKAFGADHDHPQVLPVAHMIGRILNYENLFYLPKVNWTERLSTSQLWEVRDLLNEQRQCLDNYDNTRHLLYLALTSLLDPLYTACPSLLDENQGDDGITVPTDLIQSVGNVGTVVESMIGTVSNDGLEEANLFSRHQRRLEENIISASGGNPNDPKGFNRAAKMPGKSDIKNPSELVDTYLNGTPIGDLFDQKTSFTIPTSSRFEHHHIIAGSGHGKTQTLQYLIGQDLDAVAAGHRSVVVIDSQGDLIKNISQLDVFAPGGALHDRVVIIDPTDVEWPVSLNLFDVGIDRLKDYPPLEQERLTNSILELYDFVLGSLLSAEMTQKQNVIFRYVTRLMLHIPDATIHTLRELMEPGSHEKFAEHIGKLKGTAKRFFETEFASKEFEQTKKQVLRRLWGILENQTFERMFSHPRSKLDLFAELNSGKVILINTAKDLLKEQGTQIFGRFFIALIAQAAQERATLPENERMPTFVYIDEAADYFDRNIGIILSQARKYGVGMILAHQYLGQLDPKLQEAFAANTSIKFAGGVSTRDAKALAQMLGCDAGLIEAQPKGHFAASIRGVTKNAIPLGFPFGSLEQRNRMSAEERHDLQEAMRQRYAVHYSELYDEPDTPEDEEKEEKVEEEPEIPKPEFPEMPEKEPDLVDTDAKPKW